MQLRAFSPGAGSLVLAAALNAATPALPPVEEWPPVEPAFALADGFQQTGWAEYQWLNYA